MINIKMIVPITFFVAVCVALSGIPIASGNIQYPTDSRKMQFIESAMSIPKSSSLDLIEDISESLKSRLELLRAAKKTEKRSIELLEEYLRLAHISEEKCNSQHAGGLVFLLHCHQHEPESLSFSYIQEIATRQFKLCLPIWDREFADAIHSIDESDRDKMERLLDQMMQIKFKNEEQPSKPYNNALLRKLIPNPPASAILLFMVSLDPREERIPVDENLKNLSFDWDKFQGVYGDFVLRLCSNVCESLDSSSKIFKSAFDYNIETDRYGYNNPLRDHWLASKMICCSIKRSHEKMAASGKDVFMKSTFDKLTIQEEIMIPNEPGLDELVAFGQALGDD